MPVVSIRPRPADRRAAARRANWSTIRLLSAAGSPIQFHRRRQFCRQSRACSPPSVSVMSVPNFSVDPESQKLCGGVDVDLVQWLLELAAERYPKLDRLACLLELDRLGVACGGQPAFLDPTSSERDK